MQTHTMLLWCALTACLSLGCLGCSDETPPAGQPPTSPQASRAPARESRPSADSSHSENAATPAARNGSDKPSRPSAGPPSRLHQPEEIPSTEYSNRNRTLADLLAHPVDSVSQHMPQIPRVEVDQKKAAAEGIRKLESRRLTLYTDMPPEPAIDELPMVFDQAFPQYCKYFGIDPDEHPAWRMTGFLMKDKDRFVRAGLLPDNLPDFPHGYARNDELWLYDQPSDYYRRHLLIHEGVHGFMNTLLGACGPPWYMEGTAELLGTHRWHDGKLTLNHMPADRDETPHWGRIRIVKEAFDKGKALTLDKVIAYQPSAYLENDAYAWSWAAAALLDHHPKYRDRFRAMAKDVLKPDFNDIFYRAIGDDRPQLSEDWQVFVNGIEYGTEIARAAIQRKPGQPLPSDGATVTIQADRGWQSSGLLLEAGKSYRLTASGRYQVASNPEPWWCEPGGVSIRYYKGKPLGQLLAAVRPDNQQANALSPLLSPVVVGLGTTLTPSQSGTLMLTINLSAAELSHCAGQLSVQVQPEAN